MAAGAALPVGRADDDATESPQNLSHDMKTGRANAIIIGKENFHPAAECTGSEGIEPATRPPDNG